ncbi:MAG: hypothetical protein QMD11_05500 [Smithella sp.]|nr:hypothetical protein [Smithella sp.]
MKAIDETGNRYGRLVVVGRVESDHKGQAMWECECECGSSHIARGALLRNGTVRSCGCLAKDTPPGNATHMMSRPGKKHNRLYRIWTGMKTRCSNNNDPSYPNYGGRGISVCDEWQEFQPFMEWALKNGYKKDLTIDRKNNDGHYEPENCRFITLGENQRNKTTNHRITYRGETKILEEWAKTLGVNSRTLQMRLSRGWRVEDAFTRPVRGAGERMTRRLVSV